ncbi:hypothetical protein ASA1KI_26260 [Opitutales bacterium ASA1]|uniref:hypothetical protein n=1 Tax=Congregicoccus parvus TaxID=3081749 RepID=UPI002B281632|nr:hypothetical protein ASA1KI_26260 [Opitutales bacterium ASA1]
MYPVLGCATFSLGGRSFLPSIYDEHSTTRLDLDPMTPDGFDHIHVTLRGTAAGAITRKDIEQRARELALLRTGRKEISDRDRAAAERELLGASDPTSTHDEVRSRGAATRDPQFALQSDGPVRDQRGPEDENDTPETLALQGVEEAQHDLMVTAEETDEDKTDGKATRPSKRSPVRNPPATDYPDLPGPA